MTGDRPSRWSRRGVCAAVASATVASLLGCDVTTGGTRMGQEAGDAASRGRLSWRPGRAPVTPDPGRPGDLVLETDAGARALAYAPRTSAALRLVVLLHGAGGEPERTIHLLRPYADREGLLVVAPKSAGATWDVIAGGFGPDVRAIDDLLRRLTSSHRVAGRTIAGFSDGASYALTLGIANGDVFDSVVAFSPGFQAAPLAHGRPRFFVSHGTADRVLPIDRCSRRLVPLLERRGYAVTYEEFEGGHEVPLDVRDRAVGWLRPA